MEVKLKECSRCKRQKSIWKNKTIEGVKSQFCKICWGITNRDIEKIRRKKQRERKKESVKFTDCKKLIQRLAKLCNDPVCCTSGYKFTEQDFKSSNAQGGHWRSAGTYPSTALYILNIHPQCYAENIGKHGNEYEYGLFIREKYGQAFEERLYRMSHISYKWSKQELLEFRDQCKEHLRMLEEGISREKVKKLFLEWQHSTEWYLFMLENLNK